MSRQISSQLKKTCATGMLFLILFSCKHAAQNSTNKIIGGAEDYETFPPGVGLALKIENWGGVCTATIVRDDLLLTAAHCLIDSGAVAVKLRPRPGVSETDPVYTDGVPINDKTRVVFPSYKPNNPAMAHNSDVAFVVFPKESFTKFQKAKISVIKPQVNDPVTLVGIGRTEIMDPESNLDKRRLVGHNVIHMVDSDHASLIHLKTESIGVTETGAAPGDSGGPLINSSGELIGVGHALMWDPVKPVTSNNSIGSDRPLFTTYINITDHGVAEFIDIVMHTENPTSDTAQSVAATPMVPW